MVNVWQCTLENHINNFKLNKLKTLALNEIFFNYKHNCTGKSNMVSQSTLKYCVF